MIFLVGIDVETLSTITNVVAVVKWRRLKSTNNARVHKAEVEALRRSMFGWHCGELCRLALLGLT